MNLARVSQLLAAFPTKRLLVIGDLPAAERAARLLALDDGSRPRVVTIDPAAAGGRLPGASGRDYDNADAIIVCGRAAAVAATHSNRCVHREGPRLDGRCARAGA